MLNILVGSSALIMPTHTAAHFHGSAYRFATLEQRSYFMGLFFFVFLFGLIYLLVARAPREYRGIIVLSAGGKLGVFALASYLFLYNRLTVTGFSVSTLNDLVMAVVFLYVALTAETIPRRSLIKLPEDIPPCSG